MCCKLLETPQFGSLSSASVSCLLSNTLVIFYQSFKEELGTNTQRIVNQHSSSLVFITVDFVYTICVLFCPLYFYVITKAPE